MGVFSRRKQASARPSSTATIRRFAGPITLARPVTVAEPAKPPKAPPAAMGEIEAPLFDIAEVGHGRPEDRDREDAEHRDPEKKTTAVCAA